MKDAVSAISCSDVIGAVARLNDYREALAGNDHLKRLRRFRRAESGFDRD
jgi:predicted aspartyl protease